MVMNEEHREVRELLQQQQLWEHQQHEASYSDFMVAHSPVFAEAIDLPKANS
jgi:hypothetical protein